jgi:hypothetical protein
VEELDNYPDGATGLEGTGIMQSGLGAERVVYYILRAAIEGLSQSERDIRRAFRVFPRREQDKIVRILKKHPLLVHFGWPRREQLPDDTRAVCGIVLGNEAMENAFLDGYVHTEDEDVFDDDDSFSTPGVVVFGEIDRFDVGCWIFADHMDLAYYYHRIVRSVLVGSMHILMRAGLQPIGMTSNDIKPAPEYLPEHPFWRQLTFTVRGSVVSAVDSALIAGYLIRVRYEGSEDLVEVIASGQFDEESEG